MDGVSGIGGIAGGGMPMKATPPSNVETASTGAVPGNAATGSVSSGQSIASLSSTSISASTQSAIADNGPVLADKQLLGLLVLMLTLEYLQSGDDEEEKKKGLLGLMLALMQQQQQAGSAGGSFMYSASSLNIESSQIQAISSESATNAYSGAAGAPQQPTGADAGAGLDVVA